MQLNNGNTYTIPVTLGDHKSYPIYIGNDTYSQLGSTIKQLSVGQKLMIVTHPEIQGLYGELIADRCEKEGFKVSVVTIPPGEDHKNMATVSQLLDKMIDYQFERRDTIVALGGGVIGDTAGFAASI
ncbi:MAG: iron-containing alcohol dehydrogenase, partial [Candidatus Margulisbacteria bacterium]|nr:iron-containing alcohol dehydrogenase [Candidatus Margulisiibacteriota bacterium]